MYQVLAYIKFLCKSTNQHGVHSPFIYSFVTKCIYNTTKYSAYDKLKIYRKELYTSDICLHTSDLGQGSKVLENKKRQVKKMARVSSSSHKNAKLLFRVTNYFKCRNILELGTSLGIGTYSLSLANKNGKITSIEGCENTSDFSKLKLTQHGTNNVQFLKGHFNNVIPQLSSRTYDLIFFDGHHNKEATISYFEMLLEKCHNDSILIFDDIYWSKEMTEAWDYIKAHKTVSVTVDCFHLGFVFLRKEQAREHFRIRL